MIINNYQNLAGRITVLSVRNVPWKWTITARGSTIASAFIITKLVTESRDDRQKQKCLLQFFLLFLGYAILYCLWISSTSFRFFLRIWLYREEDIVAGSHKWANTMFSVERSIYQYILKSYRFLRQVSVIAVVKEVQIAKLPTSWIISAFWSLIYCCLFRYQILFVFFVSILFSLSLSSLFWYHIWLLLHNR